MITSSSKIEGRKPLGLMETVDIMDLIPCVGSSQLMGIQLLQLDLRLGNTPSKSFRPLKSAENFWKILELCSLRVPFALDRSGSK
ncbi:hypothetical protein Tco_0077424 [Tanacetum coccineum]